MNARSVLIIGASGTRPSATGNQVIRNLKASEFGGRVEVFHPSGAVIEGIVARTGWGDGELFDTSVVAVAPKAVLGALEELHAGGVRSSIVMSVGLSVAQRSDIADFARRSGMLIHGPNCMGLINVQSGLMLWADEGVLLDLPVGNIGLISQSGSGAIFVARTMTSTGFSHVISTGNETALTTADYIYALARDPRTSAIGIIIESIVDSPALSGALSASRAAGKPVIALKVGRSAAGAQATVAHTGAVLADGAITEAFFARHKVPLVKDYDELASTLEVLARLGRQTVGEGRTAVVSISGGQAALAADLADDCGAVLADFTDETRVALADLFPGLPVNNPLDAGGSPYSDSGAYGRALEILAADRNVDVVVAIADAQSTLNDTEIEYEDDMLADVARASGSCDKLFVVASSSSISLHPKRIPAVEDKVPVVRGIGNALRAIAALGLVFQENEPSIVRPADLPSPEVVENFRGLIRSFSGCSLPSEATYRILEGYGLPMVTSQTTDSLDTAIAAAIRMGFPVVAKIDSPDIAHKTEVGGVIVGIDNVEQLRAAWNKIMDSVTTAMPDAKILGIEVQPQVGESVEALLGVVSDQSVGSAVVVGMGGVYVELYKDAKHALAPVTGPEARALIADTNLSVLLDGYRDIHPRIDPTELVDLVVRLSWLASDLDGTLAEFDANPVLINPVTSRALLIDALLVAA